MNIIGAFHWDGSNPKSISTIIIDEDYSVRLEPSISKLKGLSLIDFKIEAEKLINNFFREIETFAKNKNGNTVTVEYKIVGHASVASPFHTQMHKPSDCTEFVRDKFHECFNKLTEKYSSLTLAKQYRSKLQNSALITFKQGLGDLQMVSAKRGNAFQFHLWSLALHATTGNYEKKLRNLSRKIQEESPTKKLAAKKLRRA